MTTQCNSIGMSTITLSSGWYWHRFELEEPQLVWVADNCWTEYSHHGPYVHKGLKGQFHGPVIFPTEGWIKF